ncbi:hypothetical protein Q5P01_007252 [Channa striata]|uniref:Uncharacterized protein n=1 Tax=Channa striata TaxID=64152 RepID=A0AA88SW74_CHASR|nr:hypothetical protein Q5P01_007252 [Channa striata]
MIGGGGDVAGLLLAAESATERRDEMTTFDFRGHLQHHRREGKLHVSPRISRHAQDICLREVPKRHLNGVTAAIIKRSRSFVKLEAVKQKCLMRPALLVIETVMAERTAVEGCL